MKRLQFCLTVFAVLALSFSAFAQVEYSQFTGTVTDPTGAAIANAKVTVSNPATDLNLTAMTNATGNYTVKEVPPGVYRITVEAASFKTTSNNAITANAGTIAHVDFKMQIGKASEVVEVTGEASVVNTEDSKLSTTVDSTQISNLPLNGRNVYDLMQLAPGAVNVTGVDMEGGHNTVVNGVRENFNGFLINGESNKDISGGNVNTPIQDTVAEFQQLTLNMSAQYGSSAGSINNLVTKSGTNGLHGSVWEYVRNSDFDANEFFLNQVGAARPPLHFNQFGFTVGGPIIKDKLFFFGSYQGDRFVETAPPSPITVESPQWRSAVEAGAPNSVAALLYNNFAPSISGTAGPSLDQYAGLTATTPANYNQWFCNSATGGASSIQPNIVPIIGVVAQDVTNATAAGYGGCASALSTFVGTAGTMTRSSPFENTSVALFGSQTQSLGNLFNGNEAMGRLDYNWSTNNRLFAEVNWEHQTDQYGPCSANCTRGFANPPNDYFPNGQLSFVHTFSPTVLNEFKVGYTQNNTQVGTNLPGVPFIAFADGTTGFGSYNGYPQYFKDHEYSYGDMVSISHGSHSFKVGVDVRRNLENSVFNVARPSYLFNDPIFFAADTPGSEVAGVNPDFCSNTACNTYNANPQAELASSVRHFRNWEVGSYFQDDWKATKRLTLNLGLRWDFYQRHTEEAGLTTTFDLGPSSSTIPGIAGQVANANVPFSTVAGPNNGYATTCNPSTVAPNTQILAGVCGSGGFAPASSLGPNQYHDFGPRVGFAWDVFGDGKTSLRGGFGISYEGTLYNPLSNSRWNPPYYSFNEVGPLDGVAGTIIYGPTTCTGTTCVPSGAKPAYTGAAGNPGQGTGAQAVGNLSGWDYGNTDAAFLTGIVLPQGVKDPYVDNFFFGVQREIAPKWVVEADYVGTAGHRLFRSQQINRTVGGALPVGSSLTNNIGETVHGLSDALTASGAPNLNAINPAGFPNPNYGILRQWANANNSNYNGLQLSIKKQMSHGMLFNANYTWSHSIDNGSSWHDAATTAAGAAAGDGYSTDVTNPAIDRGNSVFDIRHRLSLNYVYNLPGQNLHGAGGAILGGWTLNGIWSFQTGAHWSPYAHLTGPDLVESNNINNPCTAADVNNNNCENLGGEWTLDGQFPGIDRPNSSASHFSQSRSTWENGWPNFSFFNSSAPASYSAAGFPTLSAPCLACVGNLGRNTFEGPGQWSADMTLGKTFTMTERFKLKFEAAAFNIFNRANFLLATTGGGANNSLDNPLFGEAAGTLDGRDLQLGLKLIF
jgi:hypothetical protein